MSGPFEVNGGATFTGGGAQFDTAVLFTEDVTLGSATTFGSTATFVGLATFNGSVECNDDVEVNGQLTTDDLLIGISAQFNGAVTIGNSAADTLIVNADTTFEDDVLVNGTLTTDDLLVGVSAQFNGDIGLGNNVADELSILASITTAVGFTGAGRVKWRVVDGGDATASFSPLDYDLVKAATILTADRTYTVDGTSTSDGDHIEFAIVNQPFDLTIEGPGGAPLVIIAAGQAAMTKFFKIGSTWHMAHVEYDVVP